MCAFCNESFTSTRTALQHVRRTGHYTTVYETMITAWFGPGDEDEEDED